MTDDSLFADAPLALPMPPDTLAVVEMPSPRHQRKTPRPVRALQPGDPACWAWQPFSYRVGPGSVEAAMRALRAWHKRRCGMCGEVPRLLVVDHDHNTALVRGLLCDDCNKREGTARAKDDVFARWRAVPSAAILGVVAVYASQQTGVADPMPFKVTGPPFLPEWAPPHHPWPPAAALARDQPPGYAGRPPRPTQAAPMHAGPWPVQVGDEVALGLREHMHGVAECRIGQVEAVTSFGIRLAMAYRSQRWSQTIRWEAIEEIVHAPMMDAELLADCDYPPDAQIPDPAPLYAVAAEWGVAPTTRNEETYRKRVARRERRMISAGYRFPGYL